MAKLIKSKATFTDSPAWIWTRIRAIRNYRAEIDFLEASLMELKHLAESKKQKQPATN